MKTFLLIGAAAASFHLAFAHFWLSPFIALYLWALVELAKASDGRRAFYAGIAVGLLVFAPKLGWFFGIFGIASVALWMILALWHGLFFFVASWVRMRGMLFLIPILWTGIEYFRSELYPLKFSWMAAGYAFAERPGMLVSVLGVYGAGFVLMAAAMRGWATTALIVALFLVPPLKHSGDRTVQMAGMQMEFPVELEIPGKLDKLLAAHPNAEIIVLSEYTFDGPVPPCVLRWCKRNQKHLVVGGKDPAAGGNFYNTAFVIGPNGGIVFKQVKAVPIQFFSDGLPAPEQKVWDSPWGKIGIGVCYDFSFTRVLDELASQGAQMLIAPTMDVSEWGEQQHNQHALIAPMRAAEYRVPIFKVASSGISQAVNARGRVEASTPFPGPDEMIAATVSIAGAARRPLDRWLAPVCSGVSAFVLAMALLGKKFAKNAAVA